MSTRNTESKFSGERYLRFTPPPAIRRALFLGQLLECRPAPFCIDTNLTGESTSGPSIKLNPVRPTQRSEPEKNYCNFHWLPYIPGAVTHFIMPGVDVITGPMSGCDLAVILINGVQHAAHVGTADGEQELNREVKKSFNVFAHGRKVVRRFNPARAMRGLDFLPQKADETRLQTFGIIGADGRFHAFYAWVGSAGLIRTAGFLTIPPDSNPNLPLS